MKTSYFLSDITGQEFFLSVVSNFELFLFLGFQPYFTNNMSIAQLKLRKAIL
jgi:hypothetical protein